MGNGISQVPGAVTLLGSGETSNAAGQIYESIARQFPVPLQISVLETPAGFEVNAERVAGRVADFFTTRLQNFRPQVHLIAARKKGTPYSPDLPEVVQPLYASQIIFFGPGSPTYTVRQLENSLTWHVLQARHRLGANLVLASAATISISKFSLPVYEIYKVGEDPYWKPGLDFFQPYGLRLAIIPHWNNREGGEEVDTSRCFMGQERFNLLREQLPDDVTILGIDEHTALTIDFANQRCLVRGVGEIHLLRGGIQQDCAAGCSYPITSLGNFLPLSSAETGLPRQVWEKALAFQEEYHSGMNEAADTNGSAPGSAVIPEEVQRLVAERQDARQDKDWARADQLRGQIADLGWQVKDTPAGPDVQHED